MIYDYFGLFYYSFWDCGIGRSVGRSVCLLVCIMGLAEYYRTMFDTRNCCGLLMSVLEGFGCHKNYWTDFDQTW